MFVRFTFCLAGLLAASAMGAPIDFTTGIITGARIVQGGMDVRDGAFLQTPLVQLPDSRPYTSQIVPTGSEEKSESLAVFVEKPLGFASALSTGRGALEVGAENGVRVPGFHSSFSRWFTTIKNNTDTDVGFDFVFSILPGEVTLLGGRHPSATAHLRAEAFIDFQLLSPKDDEPGVFDETTGRLFDFFIDFDDLNKTSDFQTHSPNASVLCINTTDTNRCTSLALDGKVALPVIPGRGELTVFYDMFAHMNVRQSEKGARVFLGDPTDLVGGAGGHFVERSVSAVPEPAGLLLFPGAFAAILLMRRGHRHRPAS
jgi:hypothetical protein